MKVHLVLLLHLQLALISISASLMNRILPGCVPTPSTFDNLLPTYGKTPARISHRSITHTGHGPAGNLDFLLT